jgi:hypothetical protein
MTWQTTVIVAVLYLKVARFWSAAGNGMASTFVLSMLHQCFEYNPSLAQWSYLNPHIAFAGIHVCKLLLGLNPHLQQHNTTT